MMNELLIYFREGYKPLIYHVSSSSSYIILTSCDKCVAYHRDKRYNKVLKDRKHFTRDIVVPEDFSTISGVVNVVIGTKHMPFETSFLQNVFPISTWIPLLQTVEINLDSIAPELRFDFLIEILSLDG